MANYKEMYLKLVRETEKAVRILIEVQRECEELYLSASKEDVVVLSALSRTEVFPEDMAVK